MSLALLDSGKLGFLSMVKWLRSDTTDPERIRFSLSCLPPIVVAFVIAGNGGLSEEAYEVVVSSYPSELVLPDYVALQSFTTFATKKNSAHVHAGVCSPDAVFTHRGNTRMYVQDPRARKAWPTTGNGTLVCLGDCTMRAYFPGVTSVSLLLVDTVLHTAKLCVHPGPVVRFFLPANSCYVLFVPLD